MTTLWCVRAGRHGEAHQFFLEQKVIALGWQEMGDLAPLKPTRDAFKEKVAKVYINKPAGAISNSTGQLYRYIHEMKCGDLVLYPSVVDRQVHIGKITGDYVYNPGANERYPQQRKVTWLKAVPRTKFTQGALYEIGSAMTFFQVRTYTDEFLKALEGKAPDIPPPIIDETLGLVAEDIEQTTRDFILKRLAQELKGHPFAEFTAHLLGAMGYRCRISPEGPDGGIDIIAHKDELGFVPPIIKVQVKSTEGSIGDPVVSALYGKVTTNASTQEYGLLVSLGSFTAQAKSFARSKSNLRLIDGSELVDLVLQHYEQFDSRYKGLLPLRKVYIPEPLDEVDD